MTQRNFFKYLTRLHRYLGLVLGLQILIWFSSGFFMSFFDINQVRGKHIAEKVAFDLDKSSIVPLNDLPIDGATSIELKSAVGVAVYKITADDVRYFNAATAARWKGITIQLNYARCAHSFGAFSILCGCCTLWIMMSATTSIIGGCGSALPRQAYLR